MGFLLGSYVCSTLRNNQQASILRCPSINSVADTTATQTRRVLQEAPTRLPPSNTGQIPTRAPTIFGIPGKLVLDLTKYDSAFALHIPKAGGTQFRLFTPHILPSNLTQRACPMTNHITVATACLATIGGRMDLVNESTRKRQGKDSRLHVEVGGKRMDADSCRECTFLTCECPALVVANFVSPRTMVLLMV